MNRLRCGLLALVCASILAQPAGAQAHRPSRIEQIQAAGPTTVAQFRELGILYYQDGRYREARDAFARARLLAPRDASLALRLGAAEEQLGNAGAAREAYASYLATSHLRPLARRRLEARLVALRRRELDAAVREAMAAEAQLSALPPSPRTVAVLPFLCGGDDESLRGLERGLADLMITDLSRSGQLVLLERDRLHAMLDELARSARGATDSATAVRAGRLLRAGRFVQGTITQLPEGALRIDAVVVNAVDSRVTDAAHADDRLAQLFDLERRIVLGVYDALGVQLDDQMRAAIGQRPTRSIQAFMRYGLGLLARDEGRLGDAARFFGEAAHLDAQFESAVSGAEQAGAAAEIDDEGADLSLEGGSSSEDGGSTSAEGTASVVNPSLGAGDEGEGNVGLLVAEAAELDDAEDSALIAGGPQRYVIRHVRELALPLSVSVSPLAQLRIDVSAAWTQITFDAPAFRTTLHGFTDVFVRGSLLLDGGRLVLTTGVAIPSGVSPELDSLQFYVSPQLSSDFLPWASLLRSRSISATGGAAYSLFLGGWSVGAGAAVQTARRYTRPGAGGGLPFTVRPGVAARLRLGASHALGRGDVVLGVTLIEFGRTSIDTAALDAGDRTIAQAAITQPLGHTEWTLSAWTVDRRERTLLGGAPTPPERVTNVALSTALQVGPLRVSPFVDTRWWTTAGARLGAATGYGLHASAAMGDLALHASVQGLNGSLAPTWAPRAPLDGWRASLTLRYQ